MHLDLDAFFASVEQHDHPEYRAKPVVVGALPGNRGVVTTCSYEARNYGIHSAMPISEAYRRCPDAIYLRPNMSRYSTISEQVMIALDDISPVIEPVSIDEAYIDISGLERLMGAPDNIGRLTKQMILEKVGLNSSVGIGPNRLIAKLASEHQKPDGLVVIWPDQVRDFLDPMPVSNLRGVGPKTLSKLRQLNIHKVAHLKTYSLELLQKHFGSKGGQHLYDQARGIASDQVSTQVGRQSISKETTFNQDEKDPQRLRDHLKTLAAEVGYIARRKGLKGKVVTLKIRLEDFSMHTRQRTIDEASNVDVKIFEIAWDLYKKIGFASNPVRLIGVGISDWGEPSHQEDLFDTLEDREHEEKLYAILDDVTEKFGRGTISMGLKKKD